MSREIFAGAIWADWGISGAGGAIGYSFRQGLPLPGKDFCA
jgi:hypothetical protein